MAMCTLSTTNLVPSKPNLARSQVFVLWGCFLGLQLGKSRFRRCSAPYFSIFAVQVHTLSTTIASQSESWQLLHSSCPHQCVQCLRSVRRCA
jgi:hypothetical protein